MGSTIQRVLYPNGQLKTEAPLVNERIHGIKRDYHPNGQLAAEIPFDNGFSHGTAKLFALDGRLLGKWTSEHGTGVIKQWYNDGRLSSEVSIVKGLLTGRQKTWYEDGVPLPDCYWIRGKKVSRKQYITACETDSELPRYND